MDCLYLTPSTLGKIFRWRFEIFFPETRIWHFRQIVSNWENLPEMYLDTITDSKTELFKFYYRHGKDLRCPNIQCKSGSQNFVKLNIQKCPALLWLTGVLTLSLLVKTFVVCWYRLQTVWTQISCRSWPGSKLFDTLIWIYFCTCHKRFWNNCFYGMS